MVNTGLGSSINLEIKKEACAFPCPQRCNFIFKESDLETVNGVLPLMLNVYDTGNQNFKESENLGLFHYGN